MRILKDLWAIIVILILMAVCATALCQRDYAIRRYETAEITMVQRDNVIDCLETFTRLQVKDNEVWIKENRGLAVDIVKQNEAIRGYKALNEALEGHLKGTDASWAELNDILMGRIDKITSSFHIRELELLAEIERLKECIRSGVLPSLDLNQLPPKKSPGFPVPKGKHGGWVHPPYYGDKHGRHNQTKARSRVAHPERPCGVSEDTGMGCGGDARERFSTRHPRLVPLQKRVQRKMGRR